MLQGLYRTISYEHANELIRALITMLPNGKYQKIALLWLDLLETPRSKQIYPDDVQRTVQLYFLICIMANLLVGPFKKKPKHFSKPLHYIATNYSVQEIRELVLKTSISLLNKEYPHMAKDDCIGIIHNIHNFGIHYSISSKERFDKNIANNVNALHAFQVVKAKCAKKKASII